jgi:hypothetical protein
MKVPVGGQTSVVPLADLHARRPYVVAAADPVRAIEASADRLSLTEARCAHPKPPTESRQAYRQVS